MYSGCSIPMFVLVALTGGADVHAELARADETPVADSAAVPAAASAERDERSNKAYALYEQGRHIESALEFEGLWEDFKIPGYLFNAAVNRVSAKHYAHATAYLEEFMALPGVSESDLVEARAQLEVAQVGLVPVTLNISVPAGHPEPIHVVAKHKAEFTSDIRPELEFAVAVAEAGAQTNYTHKMRLDPGTWTVQISSTGLETVELAAMSIAASTPRTESVVLEVSKIEPVPVTLNITVPTEHANPIRIVATRRDKSASEGPAELPRDFEVAVTGESNYYTHVFTLDPGIWTLSVESAGLETVELHELPIVEGSPRTEAVFLQPGDIDPTSNKRRHAAIGYGIMGGAGLVAGTVIAAVGHGQLSGVGSDCQTANDTLTSDCSQRSYPADALRATGFGVMFAGAGVLAGGLPILIDDHRTRRIVLISMLATGGLVTAGGAAGYAIKLRDITEYTYASTYAPDADPQPTWSGLKADQSMHSAMTAVFGFGLGLTASSAANLIVLAVLDKRDTPQDQDTALTSLTPGVDAGAGRLALTLSGRF